MSVERLAVRPAALGLKARRADRQFMFDILYRVQSIAALLRAARRSRKCYKSLCQKPVQFTGAQACRLKS